MTGVIATIPRFQFSNAQGNPLVNGMLYTYLAGTTTPASTYQDQTLTIENTNPVRLDARGECVLWLDPAKSYKFVLKNALGVTQWTQDNVVGALASNREGPVQTETQIAAEGQTTFVLKKIAYTPGIGSLHVYVDGFRLSPADYIETARDTVTFVRSLAKDQEVLFEAGSGVNSQSITDPAMIPYSHGPGAAARNVQDKLRETVSAFDFGAKGGGADDTAAIQAGLNDGLIVYIPGNHEFVITSKLVPVSGAGLVGDGEGSRIRLIGATTQSVIEGNGVNDFYIDGVVLDGDNGAKTSGSHGIKATNCNNWQIGWLKIVRPQNWGVAFYGGSTGNRIGTLIVEDAKTSSALMFSGSSSNKVGKLIAKRCGGFGAQIFDNSNENQIDIIEAEDGGLEALGINSSSHRNRIGSVFALRSGDNGVSISGDNNVVTSVFADGVRFNGLCFYGSRNNVGSVVARNIGQHTELPYAGVAFNPAFGGLASDNIVGSVFAIDDQGVPTMDYAVWATNNTDVVWTSGATVGPATWRKYNNRVYKTDLGGVTGATPPTHTAGTVSDGGVSWAYMLDALPATRNKVGPTTAFGYTNVKFAGTNLGNYFGDNSNLHSDITFGAAFGLRREALAWAASQNISYGTWRTNAGGLYICTNVGGTSSVAPTHTTGTVTGADSIAWRFVEPVTALPTVVATSSGAQVHGKLQLVSVANGTNVASIAVGSGTPEAVVSDTIASMFLRTDGQIGNEVYVHADASGPANWQTIQLRRRGVTSSRPVIPSGGAYAGISYFDTTLMKPIWSNTTGGWVDATGAAV